MKRIVGLRKAKTSPIPKPGLNDVIQAEDRRTENIDSKIRDCDKQLRSISQQISHSVSESNRQSLKQKARSILLRKKRYEQQAEASREKSFNLDSIASGLNSAEDAKIIAGVLKSQTKVLKKDLKKINLDEIEAVKDELGDLIELTEDVSNAFSRNYDVPSDIDDEDLENQLELLGDEIIQDNDPSYIDAVISPSTNMNSSLNGPTPNAPVGTDEFGLPVLNTNESNLTPAGLNAKPSSSVSKSER